MSDRLKIRQKFYFYNKLSTKKFDKYFICSNFQIRRTRTFYEKLFLVNNYKDKREI